MQFTATAPSHDDVRGSFKLTIEPAPLTATIGDVTMNYTGGSMTPAVVTNVTGLVRPDLNQLTCEFRDESGEWQRDMPSFTVPGTYRVFFRASAPNHTTFTTNCTVTIIPWDYRVNMDGATGYDTPIVMGRPEWLVSNSGKTGEYLSDSTARYEALDAICPNGLRLWQNYVLERKDFGKKVVATVMQQGRTVDPNSFVVHFPDIEPLMTAGLRVQYRLDKKLRGNMSKSEFESASFTIGELTGKYEMNIPLGPEDPTGLYVFNIVFSPTNALIQGESVIASVATVGVLRVSSSMTNTMTAVPWRSMSLDTTQNVDVAVSDVVNPNGLSGGDRILAYDAETGNYNAWLRGDAGAWDAFLTASANGETEASAESSSLPLGSAFWLARTNPSSTTNFYLVGRYTGEAVAVVIAEGDGVKLTPTMVVNPTFWPVAINSIGWGGTPAAGDQILIPTEDAAPTVLTWNGSDWGASALEQYVKNGRIRTRVVRKTDHTVAPGRGFWYYRKATGGLSAIFPSAQGE